MAGLHDDRRVISMVIEPLTPERRRQQTRDYLLQAAAMVFAERGFHGASLDEVAAAAGFTKGAVYSNFKSKDDLFLALLEAHYKRVMEELHATLDGSQVPPEARLSDFVALIRAQRDQTEELGANWSMLYLEFFLYAMRNPAARRKLAEFHRVDVGSIAEIIEAERRRQRVRPTDPDPAHYDARIVIALLRGIDLVQALDAEVTDERFLETVLAFIARALRSTDT